MITKLRPESVRWGLSQAEKIYRDDPSAVLMISVHEFRALMALALAGLKPSNPRTVIGFMEQEHDETVATCIGYYAGPDGTLRLPESLRDAKGRGKPLSKYHRIVAEEVGLSATGK